jgi:hypothetical protein
MPNTTPTAASGIIQATIVKKCDRASHRPETGKACAAGTC